MTALAQSRQALPMEWTVNGLALSGLAWGEPAQRPVLALHGLLDNAASFARLAPLLSDCHVVAPDLPGHGQSDWRSADAGYQIWDDLPELVALLDALGWTTFDLVGHSRGAIIAALLASVYPERVRRLVLLDAVAPEPVVAENFPGQLRKSLDDKARLAGRPNRVYPDTAAAVSARTGRHLAEQQAAMLVARNLRSCDGGVTWTTDPRLRGASAVKLTEAHIEAVLGALSMPVLLLLATDSWAQLPNLLELARRHIYDIDVYTLEGGHHLHMEDEVTSVAAKVLGFLAKADACGHTA